MKNKLIGLLFLAGCFQHDTGQEIMLFIVGYELAGQAPNITGDPDYGRMNHGITIAAL